MKKALLIISGAVLAFLIGYLLGRPHGELQPRTEVVTDTVIDTISFYMPVPRDSVVLRYVTVRLPVSQPKDTLSAENYAQDMAQNMHDSIAVELPITQKHYSDSCYDAWVSGYMSQLDSIKVRQRTVNNTITIRKPPNRWAVGITGGYALTPSGLQPYIGFGVTYNLLRK